MELSEKLTRNHFVKISDDLCQYHNKITNKFGPALEIKEAEKWHEDYITKFARELDKKFSPVIKRPEFRGFSVNLNPLKTELESILDTIELSHCDDEDNARYTYEAVLKCFYGENIFDWINSQCK